MDADLIELLIECEEYFDNKADADCDETGFIPNKEMRLLTMVREALRKAEARKPKPEYNLVELLEFTQQIFNGIDTGMITIDTPADETLANVLSRGRKALSKATGAI